MFQVYETTHVNIHILLEHQDNQSFVTLSCDFLKCFNSLCLEGLHLSFALYDTVACGNLRMSGIEEVRGVVLLENI